jgi:hypothetical protein
MLGSPDSTLFCVTKLAERRERDVCQFNFSDRISRLTFRPSNSVHARMRVGKVSGRGHGPRLVASQE